MIAEKLDLQVFIIILFLSRRNKKIQAYSATATFNDITDHISLHNQIKLIFIVRQITQANLGKIHRQEKKKG